MSPAAMHLPAPSPSPRRVRLATTLVARLAAALTLVLTIAAVPLSVLAHQSPSGVTGVLLTVPFALVTLPFAVVGALVASRQPRGALGASRPLMVHSADHPVEGDCSSSTRAGLTKRSE